MLRLLLVGCFIVGATAAHAQNYPMNPWGTANGLPPPPPTIYTPPPMVQDPLSLGMELNALGNDSGRLYAPTPNPHIPDVPNYPRVPGCCRRGF